MFVCRIIWRHNRSCLLWPRFFLNLYSYNRNTATRIEIITTLCGDLIILFKNITTVSSHLLLVKFSETGIHEFNSLYEGNYTKSHTIFALKQSSYY